MISNKERACECLLTSPYSMSKPLNFNQISKNSSHSNRLIEIFATTFKNGC